MNEQEVIDLIRNRLKLEANTSYGLGFSRQISIKLMLKLDEGENSKYECISEEIIPFSAF